MDRSPADLGRILSDIQRDLEELKVAQAKAYEIPDGAVTSNKLADSSVTTAKVADSSITNEKLNLVSEDFTSKVSFAETPINADFRRIGNLVIFMVQGASKAHAANSEIFTLPEGYRPKPLSLDNGEHRYIIAATRYNETMVRAGIITTTGKFIVETADSATKRLYVQGCFFTD